VYSPKTMVKIFVVMVSFKINSFRSLSRFLTTNKELRKACGLKESVPNYRTLSRRLKTLESPICQLVKQIVRVLYQQGVISLSIVATDSTLLEAKGRRRHKDKPGTYATDPDAAWGWSESRGWVFGYKLHLTTTVLWRGEIIPLSWKVTPANIHDTIPFLPLIARVCQRAQFSGGRVRISLADKGYDYNDNYLWHQKKKIWLITPVRRFKERKEHFLKERAKHLVDSEQGKRLYWRRGDTERANGQLKALYLLDPLPVIGLKHVQNYCSVACFAFLVGALYNSLNGRSIRAIKSLVA